MRSLLLAVVLLSVGVDAASASCTEDAALLQARINRDLKTKPGPQVQAAAKEMQKINMKMNEGTMDEVDCYNALARARRALNAPPPAPPAPAPEPAPAGRRY